MKWDVGDVCPDCQTKCGSRPAANLPCLDLGRNKIMKTMTITKKTTIKTVKTTMIKVMKTTTMTKPLLFLIQ